MDFKTKLGARAPFAKSDTIEASDKPWRCRLQQEIWNKSEDEVEILGDFLWYKSGSNYWLYNYLNHTGNYNLKAREVSKIYFRPPFWPTHDM